ncbi:MAG: transposase [Planctomycetes bacterium]|nr:transposase [Planctomycetota bacterium]
MARKPRFDFPGTWHHVTNRGIAKRVLFETRSDGRYFLSRLAKQVRAGRIEVHAFCLMTTHFHLLVRSPNGEMSEAMRRAQNDYSRYFNRKRQRDGSLIRGRFFSKPVYSDQYRHTLIRYIDANPVKASMVKHSFEYELGSAFLFTRGRGPRWLSREWVEGEVRASGREGPFSANNYMSVFGVTEGDDLECLELLIEARLSSTAQEDPLEDLVGTAPVSIQRWMRRKALLADGHRPGLPVCSPIALRDALELHGARCGDWLVKDGERTWSGTDLAWLGLLRGLCGLSWKEVVSWSGFCESKARRFVEAHGRILLSHGEYAERVARIVSPAIERSFGPRSQPVRE